MRIEAKDGRIFNFESEEPYRKADGSMTRLRLWSSSCVTCGDLFVVKTPGFVNSSEQSGSFGRKHCDEHKLTKDEAIQVWIASRTKKKNK